MRSIYVLLGNTDGLSCLGGFLSEIGDCPVERP